MIVFVTRDAATRTCRVAFRYDAALVEAMRAYVSGRARRWDRVGRWWEVDSLAVSAFIEKAELLGHRVVDVQDDRGAA